MEKNIGISLIFVFSKHMNRRVLTEQDVKRLLPGSPCYVEAGTILTALAREMAHQRENTIVECANAEELASLKAYTGRIALGADHTGWTLREQLKPFLQENGYLVLDCGSHNHEIVDYTDVALQVARLLKAGKAHRGIMIDSVGTGSCMVANKVPGIRAANCYDRLTAQNCREQDDANLLTLGGQLINFDLATSIVSTWLNTPFAGGQQQKRISKIEEVEQQFLQAAVVALPGDSSCAL
jgi:ribose 5-phosphate isomerase B